MTLILLDSQVVLWLLIDNPRLGRRAREMIKFGAVHVSAATVWELRIKAMLGKLKIPDKFPSMLVDQGLLMLHITADHAEGIRDFPGLSRHDPFDRILVTQASQSGLRLLTADRVLLGLGKDFIVDATL